jgi:tetratricopeptide (TPR) repeat protein
MILQWFDARQASEAGATLADKITPSAARIEQTDIKRSNDTLREIGARAGSEVRDLRLNFYQRAKLANAFKWRLIENGIEKKVADAVTQSLVIDLGAPRAAGSPVPPASVVSKGDESADSLFLRANKHAADGEHATAVGLFDSVLKLDPCHVGALNNLGLVLMDLGRFIEAEQAFRRAVSIDSGFAEAHQSLGHVLRLRGFFAESESAIRQAARLRPDSMEVQSSLGLTLILRGRVHDAKGRFRKVLKTRPRDLASLNGLAEAALMEGQWEEADSLFARILDVDPHNAAALVGQSVLLHRKSGNGAAWLEKAQAVADTKIAPAQEAALRYGIGRYLDTVGDYEHAFKSVMRANELLKRAAEPYDRKMRASVVHDLIRTYSKSALAQGGLGASESMMPVFVVGMPRSGTSLIEQIIASHPGARGAGEVDYWTEVMRQHEGWLNHGPPDERTRRSLSDAYLSTLKSSAVSAPKEDISGVLRIVDKAPVNSDYLGIIHSVFPKARIIYASRDPIDTCLSCYFQELPLTLNFALDLRDLAHYYKEHRRLFSHWRETLPPDSILEVPYESLIGDQESWTRKIIEFVGLDWNDRCLRFDETQRLVTSASLRQVRSKIYDTSIARWRNYEKFIGPLLALPEG